MKLNKDAVDLLLAKKCLSVQEMVKLAGIGAKTYYTGIKNGIYPKQAGKIAQALDCDVEEIIQEREHKKAEEI